MDGRQIREAHVPDTIADAVLARVARLSDDARDGRPRWRRRRPLLQPRRPRRRHRPATGRARADHRRARRPSILYPFDYIDQGYYDFRHQLLRDAIYGSVPPSQLRRFHAQAAEFVTSLEASSVVHAARHYERAGLRPQAFRASMTAAREASRISARHEAFELYQRAIDNMPADLPVAEQAELYERYADAAGAIEHNDEAAAAPAPASSTSRPAGRSMRRAS